MLETQMICGLGFLSGGDTTASVVIGNFIV